MAGIQRDAAGREVYGEDTNIVAGGGSGGGGGGGGSVTQGTTPWVDNITQLGGNAIATGAGASTNGTLRVIQSSDSISASNLTQVNGATVATALGASNAQTQRVAISTDSIVGVTQGSATPFTQNLTQLAGTAISVNAGAADAGTQRIVPATGSTVGLTGNATGTRNVYVTDNIDQIGGTAYTLGAKTSATAAPVVQATDGLGSSTVPATFGGRQEAFQLASANSASATPVSVYGGDYIFTQTATGYGTVALQVLGPDNTTYLTVGSYTATDTAGGHGFTFGGLAKVRVVLTGTTGANATLARVPG